MHAASAAYLVRLLAQKDQDGGSQDPAAPSSAAAPLVPWRMALSLLVPVGFLVISYRLKLDLGKKIVVGILRSSSQLLFLGYVLLEFIFSLKSPLAVFTYLLGMITVAALEARGRQSRTYERHFLDSFIACFCAGGVMGVFGNFLVFHPTPWWNPAVIIPTTGMIIGNSVSGPAVSVERLLAEVTEKKHETETRLCFGASSYEAILPIVRISIQAALTTTLNQLAIIGLVSIPGMMTGQLLGGTPPAIAAQYQLSIIYLLLSTYVFSTLFAVLLAVRHAVFDSDHRLTPDTIVKRQGGKQDLDAMLAALVRQMQTRLYEAWTFCSLRCCGWYRSPSASSSSSSRRPHHDDYSAVMEIEMSSPTEASRCESGVAGEVRGPEAEVSLARCTGRAVYRIEPNRLYGFCSDDRPDLWLAVEGVNIRSGDSVLFHTQNLSFTLRMGEIVTLEGPSGLGKTRLLRSLAQLDPFLCGTASYGNATVRCPASQAIDSELSPAASSTEPSRHRSRERQVISTPLWRERILYVPQALPPMAGSPLELLRECGLYHVRSHSPDARLVFQELERHCDQMEEALGLRTGLLSQPWNVLSGGERQRAAIACALLLAQARPRHVVSTSQPALSPSSPQDGAAHWANVRECVLLLDEPTAACDPSTTLAVEAAIKAAGVAVVMTTHDDRQALRLAHRRILLEPLHVDAKSTDE